MERPMTKPLPWRALATLSRVPGVSRLVDGHRDIVLMYHSVGGIPGTEYAADLSPELFKEQIRRFVERYEPVDLPELIETETSAKRFAVTFDDGFRNVAEEAVPILHEFGVPATVFLCPAFVGDESADLLRDRHNLDSTAYDIVMTDAQVRRAVDDDLMTIGNHTASHPDLTTLADRAALEREILGGKEELESRYGISVDRFSYPYGRFDSRAADVVEATHEYGVTSQLALVQPGTDPHQIPRVDVHQPTHVLEFETTDLGDRLKRLHATLTG